MNRNQTKSFLLKIPGLIILIIFLLIFTILSPIILLYFTFRMLRGFLYGLLVKQKWYPKRKYLLFVYSDSPNWKEYIETNIFPKIKKHTFILNWSERNAWKPSLTQKIFKHWTGIMNYSVKGWKSWEGTEYNPVAIVFVPWWKPKVIRFWQAFKDYKHGKDANLKKCEVQLFNLLNKKLYK